MKELIITGLGSRECAVAAAVLLKSLKGDADVVGMSKRRLPQFLSTADMKWKRIHILGVPLGGDEKMLFDALSGSAAKVSVSWVGCEPLSESQNKNIRPLMQSVKCVEGGGDVGELVKAVAKAYKVEVGDLKKFIDRKEKMSEKERALDELLEAALYAYRTYQDQQPYRAAIACLANGEGRDGWGADLRRIVARFQQYGDRELAGTGSLMRETVTSADVAAANAYASVLLIGESGTGKSALAARIHARSPRRNEPYITFNCAALPEGVLQRQLFGCVSPGEDGRDVLEEGAFDFADGGTILLENVDELPAMSQGVLLRVIDRGRFVRVGGKREHRVDVRVIASSSRNLPAMVRDGKFRSDLYLRLSVIQLRIPALRERMEDVKDIAQRWWEDRTHRSLTGKQIEALSSYDYPCNVRELLNVLQRALILKEGDFKKILDAHMTANAGFFDGAGSSGQLESVALEDVIRRHVRDVFVKCGQNGSRAAAKLKISRNTLHKYVKEDEKDDAANDVKGKAQP